MKATPPPQALTLAALLRLRGPELQRALEEILRDSPRRAAEYAAKHRTRRPHPWG